jgi:cytochrome oxidase Cu insertion factor (SCO1/SenC/PrrC family)
MFIKVFLTISIVIIATFAFPTSGVVTAQTKPKQQQSVTYSCPMHPDFKSKKPGRCPKCGMTLRPDNPAPTPQPSPSPTDAATENYSFSSLQIPNVRVIDQNGRGLDFYSDLIKGHNVAINFIFTTCTTVCPVLTATFRRVQSELEKSQPDVKLISISVDPTVDTPERLRDFAEKFKAGPGWTFVTGDKTEIDSLLQRLGAGVGNKNDHTSMILIGNDPADVWTRTYGLSSPTVLLKVITDTASRK